MNLTNRVIARMQSEAISCQIIKIRLLHFVRNDDVLFSTLGILGTLSTLGTILSLLNS